MLGLPSICKSEGGPCFSSSRFGDFCRKYGITQVLTSAYNSESNGQVERIIQELKKAMEKCGPATTLNEVTAILNGTAIYLWEEVLELAFPTRKIKKST